MNKKEAEKLLFDFLDGEASPEEELFLKKKCQIDPELAKEKESLEEVFSLLRRSDKISTSPSFTEKVMTRVELMNRIEGIEGVEQIEKIDKKPMRLSKKIMLWIRSPLDIHITWGVKWAFVFSLVLFMYIAVSWQNFRLRQVSLQVSNLEKVITDTRNQPVLTRFIFYHPKAKSVYLVGNFNNWQAEENSRLVNMPDGEGIWLITIPLQPGEYEYMFLVDGDKWVTDPCAMDFQSDGFGHKNSIVEVSRKMQI
jgi:hypothetical protein